MRSTRILGAGGSILVLTGALVLAGCYNTPVNTSEYALGPVPLREPSPARDTCCYEDSLTGGQVFDMYCSSCHNAPALAERPYANFRNVTAHMRIRANLTGKELAKVNEFLRRWHDVGPQHPPLEPSPKRFEFGQPIQELRGSAAGDKGKAGQQPAAGAPAPPPAAGNAPAPGAP
jgi:hypothetical protein